MSLLVSKGTPALLLKCNWPFDDDDDAQNKISAHTHPICTRKKWPFHDDDEKGDNDFDLRLSRPSTITLTQADRITRGNTIAPVNAIKYLFWLQSSRNP